MILIRSYLFFIQVSLKNKLLRTLLAKKLIKYIIYFIQQCRYTNSNIFFSSHTHNNVTQLFLQYIKYCQMRIYQLSCMEWMTPRYNNRISLPRPSTMFGLDLILLLTSEQIAYLNPFLLYDISHKEISQTFSSTNNDLNTLISYHSFPS